MVNFALLKQYAKKPTEMLVSLDFYPISEWNRDFQHSFFGVAQAKKEVTIVFHDYSTITRVKYVLLWPHFRLFSTVIMLEL